MFGLDVYVLCAMIVNGMYELSLCVFGFLALSSFVICLQEMEIFESEQWAHNTIIPIIIVLSSKWQILQSVRYW